MFKTGLGRSVKLKQSSIAKALSVLGNYKDGNVLITGMQFFIFVVINIT